VEIFPQCMDIEHIIFWLCFVWKYSTPPSDAEYESFSFRTLRRWSCCPIWWGGVDRKWFGYVRDRVIYNWFEGRSIVLRIFLLSLNTFVCIYIYIYICVCVCVCVCVCLCVCVYGVIYTMRYLVKDVFIVWNFWILTAINIQCCNKNIKYFYFHILFKWEWVLSIK